MSDDAWKISVNIRPGAVPQISIHADDGEEAYALLGEVQAAEFVERVNDVTADYTAVSNVSAATGKVGVTQQANTPGRQMDPQGRSCGKCGTALYYIEGEKNGRKWKAYGHEGTGYGHDRHFF